MDEPYFPAQVLVKLVAGFRLEYDDARGELKRLLSIFALLQIAIQISARERNNDWPVSMLSPEAPYGLVTTPGVKGNQ